MRFALHSPTTNNRFMIILEIKAKIHASKLVEFSQVKVGFIHAFQSATGFISFVEKPSYQFLIQISLKDRQCLSAFTASQKFLFFKGALVALSITHHISVITQKHIYNKIN